MGFIDDIKEDQKMQIQAVCVVFFLLAFPSYFFLKAAATDDPSGMGGVGTYSVTGEFSYIDFDSGEETIADGTPFVLDLNTDALSSEDQGKNIVGVLVSMSYGRWMEQGSRTHAVLKPLQIQLQELQHILNSRTLLMVKTKVAVVLMM